MIMPISDERTNKNMNKVKTSFLKYSLLEFSSVHHIAANTRLFSHILIGLVGTNSSHLSLSALDSFLVAKSFLDTRIAIFFRATSHQTTIFENLLSGLTTLSLLQLLFINTLPHSKNISYIVVIDMQLLIFLSVCLVLFLLLASLDHFFIKHIISLFFFLFLTHTTTFSS